MSGTKTAFGSAPIKYYFIVSSATSTVIDNFGYGSAPNTKTTGWQWKIDGSNNDNQQWHFQAVPGDGNFQYYFIVSKATGNYLDVNGDPGKNLSPVVTSPPSGKLSQQWRITAIENTLNATPIPFVLSNRQADERGSSNFVVDLNGGDPKPGTPITMFEANKGKNQSWVAIEAQSL